MCAGSRSVSRLLVATLFGAAITAAASSPVRAQTSGAPEKYNANAVNMGSGPSGMTRLLITVERWSTAAEREKLLKTLTEKGPEKLLDVLQDHDEERVRPRYEYARVGSALRLPVAASRRRAPGRPPHRSPDDLQ